VKRDISPLIKKNRPLVCVMGGLNVVISGSAFEVPFEKGGGIEGGGKTISIIMLKQIKRHPVGGRGRMMMQNGPTCLD